MFDQVIDGGWVLVDALSSLKPQNVEQNGGNGKAGKDHTYTGVGREMALDLSYINS